MELERETQEGVEAARKDFARVLCGQDDEFVTAKNERVMYKAQLAGLDEPGASGAERAQLNLKIRKRTCMYVNMYACM